MTGKRALIGLIRAEAGAVAVYVAVIAAVLLGTGGLALDLGRYMTLNTELQHAADAAALAGAAELNGEDDAIDRATLAIGGAFGSNVHTFATDSGNAAIAVAEIAFLSVLGADRASDVETTDPHKAYYVRVTVEERGVDVWLAGVLVGPRQLRTVAEAVAGFNRVACKIPPLMVCNPYEPPSPIEETPFLGERGEMVLVKSHDGPQGGQWAPGTFGLLDPPDGNQGAKAMAEFLAAGASPGCYARPNISVRPGQVESTRSALNTRFDVYELPFFNTAQARRNFPPAPNVTKGRYMSGAGTECSQTIATDPTQAAKLPRDTCFETGTCSRFGDGVWDATQYWQTNHGTVPMPSGLETRHDIYLWELEQPATRLPGNSEGATLEKGWPVCSTDVGGADRREIYFAAINCRYHDVRGNASNLSPVAFVKAFLTEPATGDSALTNIFLEIVHVANAQDDTEVIHDVVQLYR